jgi:cytidine deaminase
MSRDSDIEELIAAARTASTHAYCPYSHFPVGAAVRTVDGRIFAGSNVENASYGLAVCAERNAIFHAVNSGAQPLTTLVVFTPTTSPVTPCGACRQVLWEFGRRAQVVCACDGLERLALTAAELLPHGFVL